MKHIYKDERNAAIFELCMEANWPYTRIGRLFSITGGRAAQVVTGEFYRRRAKGENPPTHRRKDRQKSDG